MLFPGVGLSFYGIIPRELPISPSLAAYSIDGGPNTPVALKGLPPGSVTLFNQKFFETPTLPYGLHTLKVTYNGDDGNASTPLVLDFLLIQNGSISPNTTASLPASTSPPVLASAAKKVNVAGVVCGVLAALAAVLILAFLFLKYRKQKEVKFAPSSKFLAPIPFLRQPPRPIQESTSFSTLGLFTPAQSAIDLAAAPPTHRRRTSRPKPPEASGSRPRRFAAPPVPPIAANDQTSYYGGYQTWGQAKAQEAASKKATARPRDSYM